jgi:hypothetical protein
MRLRDEMFSFHDTHELGTVLNELMRSEEVGTIVGRELTAEMLQRLFEPR